MKKWITFLMIGVLMAGSLVAQGMMQDNDCINPKYYQFMVFRMTEELDLTSAQAEQLFPLLRPYRETKRQYHDQMARLGEEAYQLDNYTSKDLEHYKNEIRRLHQDEIQLDEAFYEKIETFLTAEQVTKFIFFEPRFRMELSRELKARYQNQKPHDKNKNFWNKRK